MMNNLNSMIGLNAEPKGVVVEHQKDDSLNGALFNDTLLKQKKSSGKETAGFKSKNGSISSDDSGRKAKGFKEMKDSEDEDGSVDDFVQSTLFPKILRKEASEDKLLNPFGGEKVQASDMQGLSEGVEQGSKAIQATKIGDIQTEELVGEEKLNAKTLSKVAINTPSGNTGETKIIQEEVGKEAAVKMEMGLSIDKEKSPRNELSSNAKNNNEVNSDFKHKMSNEQAASEEEKENPDSIKIEERQTVDWSEFLRNSAINLQQINTKNRQVIRAEEKNQIEGLAGLGDRVKEHQAASPQDNAVEKVVHSSKSMEEQTIKLRELSEKFTERLQSMVEKKQQILKLTVIPPSLGKLTITCKEQNGCMQVGIHAQSLAVRQLIMNQEGPIRSLFEEHGNVLEQFDVTYEDQSNNQRESSQFEDEFEEEFNGIEHAESDVETDKSKPTRRVRKDGRTFLVA